VRAPVWLTPAEHRTVAALLDLLVPRDGVSPGAGEAGGADYVDQLLGAFTFDPPRIWAGGPYSGRFGGDAGFSEFLELSRLEELAWRTRIEGSRGLPEREWSGPVRGWQEGYREGVAALGPSYLELDDEAAFGALDDVGELRALLFDHACEASYGAPEYGGNRDGGGWRAIRYAGDVQPRGWSDEEVAGA